MRIYKKVEKEYDELDDVLCNKCGNTCKVRVSTDGLYNIVGLESEYVGCYGSEFDLMSMRFDLCEPCLKELFAEFKIPCKVKEVAWGYEGT